MQSHQYGAGTDIGNARENNEDTYVCATEKELWIVADGMGGLGFGEAASAITAYTVTNMVKSGHGINQAIEGAHKNIKEYAETEGQGTNMGTTVVLLLSQGNIYNVFWVGDSRGYLFDGTLRQITRDHSLVQALIDQGELTEEEAQFDPRKNAITKALGVRELESVRPDSVSDKWHVGDKILLCSDGLSDCVSDNDIEAILQAEGTDQQKVDRLIQKALDEGGRDNITVVLVSAPDSVSNADSDTEVPDRVEAAAHDENARDDADTNVMGRPRAAHQRAREQGAGPALQPGGNRRAADSNVAGSGSAGDAISRPPTGPDTDTGQESRRGIKLSLRYLLPLAAAILLFTVWTGFFSDDSSGTTAGQAALTGRDMGQ